MNEISNLSQLVSEIKFYENQAVISYWEIGKRLAEAKEEVEHGEWINWIDNNLGYTRRTASSLIKIYKEFPNGNPGSHLAFKKVLALTSIKDEEEREEFQETHKVENMTVRELEKEIKEFKQSLKESEEALREQSEINEALSNDLQEERRKERKVVEKEKIVEVEPEDYRYLKDKTKYLEEDLEKTKMANESLRRKEKETIKKLKSEEANEKILADINGLAWEINGFIRKAGGLLYLTEYLNEVPKANKKLFTDAIRHIKDFSDQLYQNYEREIKGE